jgi:hypothetical protein
VFTSNFAGAMQRPGNKVDLAQVKQHRDETLREYTHRFFDKKATVINISDREIIDYFQEGLGSRRLYEQFGLNRLLSAKTHRWASTGNMRAGRPGASICWPCN